MYEWIPPLAGAPRLCNSDDASIRDPHCEVMLSRSRRTSHTRVESTGTKTPGQKHRTGPGHDLAGTAIHSTSFLCPSRRWGKGETGQLATYHFPLFVCPGDGSTRDFICLPCACNLKRETKKNGGLLLLHVPIFCWRTSVSQCFM